MTGYTVHTGASKKFVSGWDKVFGSGAAEKTVGKSTAKAGAKSSSVKKSSGAKAKKGKKK